MFKLGSHVTAIGTLTSAPRSMMCGVPTVTCVATCPEAAPAQPKRLVAATATTASNRCIRTMVPISLSPMNGAAVLTPCRDDARDFPRDDRCTDGRILDGWLIEYDGHL